MGTWDERPRVYRAEFHNKRRGVIAVIRVINHTAERSIIRTLNAMLAYDVLTMAPELII